MNHQQLTFVVLSDEPDFLAQAGSVLATQPHVKLLAVKSAVDEAYSEIVRLRPSGAIISFGPAREKQLALLKRLAVECPETMIIGAARDASPDTILSSLRAGAHEFLRLPIIASEFKAVLTCTAEFVVKNKSNVRRQGRLIATFSNKGGCGTSFIASNLAAALNSSTALVDLDLQGGDLAFFFHLEPKFSIADLIDNRARMDDELLAKILAPHSTRLFVLPSPTDVDVAVELKAEDVDEALTLLRERHDNVVVDLPHTFDAVTLTALDQAAEILLVMTPDVMTIRSSLRTLSVFDRLDYPKSKVQVVVNRWTKNEPDLGRRQIEQLFGKRTIHLVSNDYKAVVSSINKGHPLVEARPSATVSVEIKRLAAALGAAATGGGPVSNGHERVSHSPELNAVSTGNLESKTSGNGTGRKSLRKQLSSLFTRTERESHLTVSITHERREPEK